MQYVLKFLCREAVMRVKSSKFVSFIMSLCAVGIALLVSVFVYTSSVDAKVCFAGGSSNFDECKDYENMSDSSSECVLPLRSLPVEGMMCTEEDGCYRCNGCAPDYISVNGECVCGGIDCSTLNDKHCPSDQYNSCGLCKIGQCVCNGTKCNGDEKCNQDLNSCGNCPGRCIDQKECGAKGSGWSDVKPADGCYDTGTPPIGSKPCYKSRACKCGESTDRGSTCTCAEEGWRDNENCPDGQTAVAKETRKDKQCYLCEDNTKTCAEEGWQDNTNCSGGKTAVAKEIRKGKQCYACERCELTLQATENDYSDTSNIDIYFDDTHSCSADGSVKGRYVDPDEGTLVSMLDLISVNESGDAPILVSDSSLSLSCTNPGNNRYHCTISALGNATSGAREFSSITIRNTCGKDLTFKGLQCPAGMVNLDGTCRKKCNYEFKKYKGGRLTDNGRKYYVLTALDSVYPEDCAQNMPTFKIPSYGNPAIVLIKTFSKPSDILTGSVTGDLMTHEKNTCYVTSVNSSDNSTRLFCPDDSINSDNHVLFATTDIGSEASVYNIAMYDFVPEPYADRHSGQPICDYQCYLVENQNQVACVKSSWHDETTCPDGTYSDPEDLVCEDNRPVVEDAEHSGCYKCGDTCPDGTYSDPENESACGDDTQIIFDAEHPGCYKCGYCDTNNAICTTVGKCVEPDVKCPEKEDDISYTDGRMFTDENTGFMCKLCVPAIKPCEEIDASYHSSAEGCNCADNQMVMSFGAGDAQQRCYKCVDKTEPDDNTFVCYDGDHKTSEHGYNTTTHPGCCELNEVGYRFSLYLGKSNAEQNEKLSWFFAHKPANVVIDPSDAGYGTTLRGVVCGGGTIPDSCDSLWSSRDPGNTCMGFCESYNKQQIEGTLWYLSFPIRVQSGVDPTAFQHKCCDIHNCKTTVGHFYAHSYWYYTGEYDGKYAGLNPDQDNDYDNGIAITFE